MPCGDALLDLRFVELEAGLAQAVAHAQRAFLAVGQKADQAVGHRRAGVVDVVAEDVQFATDRRAVVDRRDLHRGHDAHAHALARLDRLGDAGDRVVVAQRQQLDARLGGALHDLRRRQRAVGVRRVRLQVKAQRHALSLCDRLSGRPAARLIGAALRDERVASGVGRHRQLRVDAALDASRRRRTAAW